MGKTTYTTSLIRLASGTAIVTSRGVSEYGGYAADVAVAAGYASYPLFANNPSAMFLTGNTGGNIQARGKSHGAVKFIYQIQ